jgi:D-alanyl-D-alanine carboxypeptidase/D-alanyl-D-alanine-endopeptidase (penicillin-binding protein 4)
LKEVVYEINKSSNNFMANQLFLTIGDKVDSASQTETLIKQWLKGNRTSADNLKMYDGSGLSVHNRCSVDVLTRVLKIMHSSKWSAEYVNSLSITGKDGTLRNVFQHNLLQNKVYAKTGFIMGARALTGYIKTLDNEMLAFSLIINKENSRIGNFNEIAEKILVELALFHRESANV